MNQKYLNLNQNLKHYLNIYIWNELQTHVIESFKNVII